MCGVCLVKNYQLDKSKEPLVSIITGDLKSLNKKKRFWRKTEKVSSSKVHLFNQDTTVAGKILLGVYYYPVLGTKDFFNIEKVSSTRKLNRKLRKKFIASVSLITERENNGSSMDLSIEKGCWPLENYLSSDSVGMHEQMRAGVQSLKEFLGDKYPQDDRLFFGE